MKEILKEHKENFKMIFKLAKIDIIKTYKGAALGWLWAFIKPVFTIFVYWFTFEIGLRSMKIRHGYPNFLWLISSVVPWFYFSSIILQGASSIKNYNYLVTKMKFPISIIPTIVNTSELIVHISLMIIVTLIFAFSGYGIDIYVLQLPIYIMLSFLFFEVLSLITSILSCISKDFFNIIKSINIMLFWMSSIIWDIRDISIEWIKKILWLNPIAFLVDGYRNCFINKIFFFEELDKLFLFLSVMLVLLLIMNIVYKKLRKDIPDVL